MLTGTPARERLRRERDFWDRLYHERANGYVETFAERYVQELAYSRQILQSRLSSVHGLIVLSIGGGVDRLAIELARRGNTVVTVDVSSVAATRTQDLARASGVADRVWTVIGNCEEVCLGRTFDVILCKRALHHMNLRAVIPAAFGMLRDGGLFVAEEPICFLRVVRWLHRVAPFHPDPVRTPDESELTIEDLGFIAGFCPECRTYFFDMLTRESIVYVLSRLGMTSSLTRIGRFEFLAINRFLKPLKYLASYVIIEGRKQTR